MIKLTETEVFNNKRNGVEFNNVFSKFTLKRCSIKENKYSGIYINQNKEETELNICSCSLKPSEFVN